ncbi:hypothetical protein HZS_1409 [Henneguya salminicola]|nr:hypothetical protein HZS_1409 [Henneguya salminicola]
MGPDLDAYLLRKATKLEGIGTDESALIHILAARSSDVNHISQIKESYLKIYGKSLEHHISGDTSGSFKNILLYLLNIPRDHSSVFQADEAGRIASQIYHVLCMSFTLSHPL